MGLVPAVLHASVGSDPLSLVRSARRAAGEVRRTAWRLAGGRRNDGMSFGDVNIGATTEVVEEPILIRTLEALERLSAEIQPY